MSGFESRKARRGPMRETGPENAEAIIPWVLGIAAFWAVLVLAVLLIVVL